MRSVKLKELSEATARDVLACYALPPRPLSATMERYGVSAVFYAVPDFTMLDGPEPAASRLQMTTMFGKGRAA
jgi:hypothetical protein